MDDDVRKAIDQAINFTRIKVIRLLIFLCPYRSAVPVYYVIATAEASSNLARYDGIRYTKRSDQAKNAIDVYSKSRGEAFGEEVKDDVFSVHTH